MKRRLIIGTAALLALVSFSQSHVHAASEQGCIVYEDDSYICGTIGTLSDQSVDRNKPFTIGCIPNGACDPTWYPTPEPTPTTD